MIATIGASLSLATAACQTPLRPNVSPRYEISGNLGQFNWASLAQLLSNNGRTYTAKIFGDGKFRFGNLRPGTYSLSFIGTCEVIGKYDNIIVNQDVVMTNVEMNLGNDCIIIGLIHRDDEISNG
jgi:hypothetical protein